MSDVMIRAEHLTKHYGPLAAVEDATFSIERGQVVAFLGPNGAGKSTTMRMLTGFMAPTRGRAEIAGINVATNRIEAAAMVGYLPENGPLYADMTPLSLLRFFGSARGLDRARLSDRLDGVIRQCSLADVVEKPISKLSRGYRQRVGMAQALLHEPQVLILDEPTAGLDPNQIRQVRGLIRELGQANTIMLSTHILQEVDAVADRVIFIHAGRIVFDGSTDEFRAGHGSLDERFQELTAA
ncbi:MAG: ABC transporter ATP-binding protein [Planctomycetota bacterium]|jgi:ABC-2 type transport system ATP-binding protein